jgi:DHA3 family macrolide efflux protein-like MFS transporter
VADDVPVEDKRPKGMAAFTIIWVGQLVSVLGTAMTQFALMIWIWEETGQATAMALMGFFTFVPMVIMMPFAGALVDRWNKKMAMMLGDLAAGLGTVAILLLYQTGSLEIWHLYLIGIFIGALGAFQFPAYSSAITLMVEKKNYARASGLVGLVGDISGIFGPPLAAFFLVMMGISGILIIDIITFTFAIGVLLLVHIPNPPPAEDVKEGLGGIVKDAGYGFKYIYKRKPLLGLQLTFFVFNLVSTFGLVVFNPMILARTGSDNLILASVLSVLAVGGVVGGVLLAVWGGPRRRINGLLGGMIAVSAIFGIGFGIGQTPVIWMIFGFMAMLLIPTLNGSSQAIWQSKVPADRQGRVFAARMVIAQSAGAAAMILVGPLADFYFEPAMAVKGSLAPTFGWLVGTGPGAGMALMILLSSFISMFVGIIAYRIRIIRNVERIIPDADPKSRLADYKKMLVRAYRKGKISRDRCKKLYLIEKAKLKLKSAE